MEDRRLKEYQYLKQLKKYVDNAEKQYIDGKYGYFIYPRQLEIHLPSDRQTPCNLACGHCFAHNYKKDLGRWEQEGLKLLHNLNGVIPYHIYGGAYCEPTANPFMFSFLATTKQYNNHFGVHTNGTYLMDLEKNNKFLTNCNEISTDHEDYISISLDAGSGLSWQKLKRKDKSDFWKILQALEMMSNIREKKNKKSHAIRIVYLAGKDTCSKEEFEFIVSLAKLYKIDSVRFSVPYDYYNKSFDEVKEYKKNTEDELFKKVEKYTKHLISKNGNDKPYVFLNDPSFTDINRFNFDKCYYSYYQYTIAADGYIYPCSAVASPTAKHLRRGEMTSDLNKFRYQCWDMQNNSVHPERDCFAYGLRGNRMALEINSKWEENEEP